MSTQLARVQTKYHPQIVDNTRATALYHFLKDNVSWEEGVKSKKYGFTRLAKALNVGELKEVDDLLHEVLQTLKINDHILGIYLNYYKDGTHLTPSHTHKDMTQLVISLGATRTLTVGSKKYSMSNGDAIVFGSSAHGIPKEPNIRDGRISIATFMKSLKIYYISLTNEELEILKGL